MSLSSPLVLLTGQRACLTAAAHVFIPTALLQPPVLPPGHPHLPALPTPGATGQGQLQNTNKYAAELCVLETEITSETEAAMPTAHLVAIDGKVSRTVDCEEEVGEGDCQVHLRTPGLLQI